MSSNTELAQREERAQGGIIQFAEEMQAIRDGNLYPNAGETNGGKLEPWTTYCKERWGQSSKAVDQTILALSVLKRRSGADGARAKVSVNAAARVATLPEKVQDAILDETTNRDLVHDKAKAARKVVKTAVAEGREATDDELIAAAAVVQPPKKKKRKMRDSRFISLFSQGHSFIEDAADYAQSNLLSETENDWAWDRVEKTRLQCDRIAERLNKPGYVRDWNDEAAVLLGGDES